MCPPHFNSRLSLTVLFLEACFQGPHSLVHCASNLVQLLITRIKLLLVVLLSRLGAQVKARLGLYEEEGWRKRERGEGVRREQKEERGREEGGNGMQ